MAKTLPKNKHGTAAVSGWCRCSAKTFQQYLAFIHENTDVEDCSSMSRWLQFDESMTEARWVDDCSSMSRWLKLDESMTAARWVNDCSSICQWLQLSDFYILFQCFFYKIQIMHKRYVRAIPVCSYANKTMDAFNFLTTHFCGEYWRQTRPGTTDWQ